MPTCSFTLSVMPSSVLPICATSAITFPLRKATSLRTSTPKFSFERPGYHFPPKKGNEFENIDSKILLRKTIELVASKGYSIGNIDATVCAERPKLNPHIPEMQQTLAEVMGIDIDDISIKATTTERLGFTGREEGISAYAVVLLQKD